jgi:hypothetical protein
VGRCKRSGTSRRSHKPAAVGSIPVPATKWLVNDKLTTKGDAIKYLIAVLLSACLLLLFAPKQATPTVLSHQVSEIKVSTITKAEKPGAIAKTPVGVKAKAKSTSKKNFEVISKPKPTPSTEPTTHVQLLVAAGISPEDYGAADYIISHESSWNPNATEPTTLAHGLVQALPYSKTGCGWTDAVCQLKWANVYATNRWGGWWGAYKQWVLNRWW